MSGGIKSWQRLSACIIEFVMENVQVFIGQEVWKDLSAF